jgi:predicted nuclease with TOPRIM domain
MNDERFMKHYVKVVNATLTESILRNVNLQANANFVDDLIGELNSENESLKAQIQEMGEQLRQIITEKDVNSEQAIKNKQEVENVRQQLNHLETFRNQLIESQKLLKEKDLEIEELTKKLDNLQSPPVTKRKKTGLLTMPVEVNTPVDTTIKDGGTF